MNNAKYLIPGLVLVLISIGPAVRHIKSIFRAAAIKKNGIRTDAVVKELLYDDEEKSAPRLRLQYTDEDDRVFEIESKIGSVFYKKLEGRKTEVIYQKTNPKNAFIVLEQKKMTYFVLIIYLILFATGQFLVYKSIPE